MLIVADVHVHSRFSRATSKELDFVTLHRAALEKGIGLVGTGDFTHPGWMAEIEEQLEPAEEGLFRLKPDLRRRAEEGLPPALAGDVRFVLQVEISNIYKKGDRTRKNHNLVFVPSIDAALKVTSKLVSIGNVASDGRPILGLDARDLLEITLESDPLAFLVPAHIWTPWFSMLGSKSGFDSTEECFGDLAEYIFAAETGLSSDPSMNWRLSGLDRLTLISNSDAHSAAKLGREANLFDIEPAYSEFLNALRTGEGFLGTIEFYPEEGKYHLDGHRKCGVRLDPEETRDLEGRCPVCGGKLTVGVMSRVQDLADRPSGFKPEGAAPFKSLVPLAEVVGEVLGVGPQSKKVKAMVASVLAELGPELSVLKDVPFEDIERVGDAPLGEAIRRIRSGELTIAAGYDGEFGTVKIFNSHERDHLAGQMTFLGAERSHKLGRISSRKQKKRKQVLHKEKDTQRGLTLISPDNPLAGLDADQRRAAETSGGPLLIVAGPGTGKTRTLVARIAHQVQTEDVAPNQVLAISFTNQAASELEERILKAVPGAKRGAPFVTTFHGLGLSLQREFQENGEINCLDDEKRLELAVIAAGSNAKKRDAEALLSRISLAKQSKDPLSVIAHDETLISAFKHYQKLLADQGALDVDDLVLRAYELLASSEQVASAVAGRFLSVSVDEYQDVNDVQAALVQLISPQGRTLCAIGDPMQAIYGFRGARPGHFTRFTKAFPLARTISLKSSWRLTDTVLTTAQSVIGKEGDLSALKKGAPVEVVECPTPESEAEQIVVRLERIIGGTSYFAIDSDRAYEAEEDDVGFGDVAVLCRLKAQRHEIIEAFGRSGIPCQKVGEDEPHDPRSEKVAVMTMHASKGREFEIVFLPGVECGLVPLELGGMTSDPEEERRLLYVAITRAKRLAVLSSAARRKMFGKDMPGGFSRFLEDLPESAIARTTPSLPKKKPQFKQLSLF